MRENTTPGGFLKATPLRVLWVTTMASFKVPPPNVQQNNNPPPANQKNVAGNAVQQGHAPTEQKPWPGAADGKARPQAVNTQVARPASNELVVKMSGDALPPVGSELQQAKNAALGAELKGLADQSASSQGRHPPDFALKSYLHALNPAPPTAGQPTMQAEYTSHLPQKQPAAVFHAFVNDPGKLFSAAGLSLRPPAGPLKDGERFFIQDKGPPAQLVPFEAKIDPKTMEVRLTSLEGGPNSAAHSFSFESDGQGGTRLRQKSSYQGNAPQADSGATRWMDKQGGTWTNVHQKLFDVIYGPGGARG
jgi:hypothetical protein